MENRTITPVFIFSLPRSGSTLLQRILGAHDEICTTSEPWILLPLVYMTRENGVYAEYGHRASVEAIGDFVDTLPNDIQDFSTSLREFATRLYVSAAHQKPGSRYFVDKTPRYHLIADQIIELFPHSKFIFLWRNPLAVAASIIETFGRGKWQLYDFKVDLFDGLESLVKACDKHHKQACCVSFEELILDTDQQMKRIFNYLELTYNPGNLHDFSNVELSGGMGDSYGPKHYRKLSDEPLDKWEQTLANPLRKKWAMKYLRWIGSERMKLMGYDLHKLATELSSIPTSIRNTPSDIVRITYGLLNCAFEVRLMRKKMRRAPSWHYVHGHT